MILLLGIPSEPPIAMVAAAAARLGLACHAVSQRSAAALPLRLDLTMQGLAGEIGIDGGTLALDRVTGALVRLMDPERLPGRQDAADPFAAARTAAVHAALADWLETTPACVMNRAGPSATNIAKPWQSRVARRCGFAVPETLVTNDQARVRAFHARHGRVIFKSISSVRSIVRELDDAALARLDRLAVLPTQFQVLVPGMDVRVHAVGRELFASEIRSEATDYRYAARDGLAVAMAPLELPEEVARRCRRLVRALGLELAGIDLRRTPDGGWVCFEVNTAPAFSYYEEETGQPIARAIALRLAGRAGRATGRG